MNNYGAMPQRELIRTIESGFVAKPKQATRAPCSALCVSLVFPCLWFSLLCFVVTFSIHYQSPMLCWIIVALAFLSVFAIGWVAMQRVMERGASASWLVFLFATSMLAVVSGTLVGNMNYWTNMQPYYELKTLSTYDSVNPATPGRQMMDAGIVEFTSTSVLDLSKAYSFQNLDTYCVAPVTTRNTSSHGLQNLTTYDFWAVGLNCCGINPLTKQFEYHCNYADSTTAHQGLRLMTDDQRQLYMLAVQQAKYTYHITTNFPIFFYWTDDAAADHQSYWEYGYKYFVCGVVVFVLFQVFAFVVATVVISKLDR